MLKTIAFVAPLGCVAALMLFGERIEDGVCPGNLAYLKSEELLEQRPGVIDVSRQDFRWVGDCRFAMTGYVDIDKGSGVDRADFEVVVALDPQTSQWRQVSLTVDR